MRLLPIHPLPMRTLFRRCILVNFAVEPDQMAAALPDHLEADLHDGHAYLSVVIAEMEKMRPAFLPHCLGLTYTQVVYRAVVRCGEARGVSFLRSDANSRAMVAAGNALTFFRFHHADIEWREDGPLELELHPSDGSKASITASYALEAPNNDLSGSRFSSLAEAQNHLTELYSAFGAKRPDGRVECVRIERSRWQGKPIDGSSGHYEAMSGGALFPRDAAKLDSVFLVENLDYHWHRLAFLR